MIQEPLDSRLQGCACDRRVSFIQGATEKRRTLVEGGEFEFTHESEQFCIGGRFAELAI